MARDEWPDDAKGGYAKDGEVYCCQGCIEGPGCTCVTRTEAAGEAPTKDEIRDDPASGAFVQSLDRETKHVTPDDYGSEAVTKAPVSDYSND
jgi:hypothetical protein